MKELFKCLALLVLLSSVGEALAQSSPNSATPAGYIVTQPGDTLKGRIDFLDWDKMPTSIRFKADTATDFRKVTVNGIHSFGIPAVNQVYVSKKVTVLEVHDRDYAVAPTTLLNLHVFMQVLVTGPKATVYQMRDGSANGRFFIEKDGNLLELINQPFYRKNEQGRFYVSGDLYREQLPMLCSDAANFRADNLPLYNETSMRRYFQRYNACFLGETVTYASSEQRPQFHLGFMTGAETLALNYPDQEDMGFDWGRPTVGISLRISQPRRNYNRFVKLSWVAAPGYTVDIGSFLYPQTVRRTRHFFEFAGGSYFGRRALRPFVYANATIFAMRDLPKSMGFFLGGGLSYQRKWELEIGHPVSLPVIPFLILPGSLPYLFLPPRVALYYYLSVGK